MSSNIVTDADRLSRGIGRVVIEFQFVEYTLAEILASLLHLREPEDTHRISAAMGFRQKVDLMCDLYEARKHPQWPAVDVSVARSALFTAEDFRNRVVHSFWYVGGMQGHWVRAKATLRTSSGLKVSAGKANLAGLEQGAQATHVIRDWYLGDTAKVSSATATLRQLGAQLNEDPNESAA
jgi:hypothetical protein